MYQIPQVVNKKKRVFSSSHSLLGFPYTHLSCLFHLVFPVNLAGCSVSYIYRKEGGEDGCKGGVRGIKARQSTHPSINF